MVFQPHRYSRTRDLFDDFVTVLGAVDVLLLLDVYSAGEAPVPGADSRALARALRLRGQLEPIYVGDRANLYKVMANVLQPNDMVIAQGAGNIGAIARDLVATQLVPAQLRDKAEALQGEQQ